MDRSISSEREGGLTKGECRRGAPSSAHVGGTPVHYGDDDEDDDGYCYWMSKPSLRRHTLCCSMASRHLSSPNWMRHSSRTFLVSLHTQQMRFPCALVTGAGVAVVCTALIPVSSDERLPGVLLFQTNVGRFFPLVARSSPVVWPAKNGIYKLRRLAHSTRASLCSPTMSACLFRFSSKRKLRNAGEEKR